MTPTSPSAGVAGVLEVLRRDARDAERIREREVREQRRRESDEAIRTVEAAMALPAKWREEAAKLRKQAGKAQRRDDGTDYELFRAAQDAEAFADELEAALGGAAPAKEGMQFVGIVVEEPSGGLAISTPAAPAKEGEERKCGAPNDGRTRYPECDCNTEHGCEYGSAPTPAAPKGGEGEQPVAFRRHYSDGACSGWYDARIEADLLRALRESGQKIEFAYAATPAGGGGEDDEFASLRELYNAETTADLIRVLLKRRLAGEDALWTDEQCIEFASVAFRHAPKNLPDGVTLNDIRLGAARLASSGGEEELTREVVAWLDKLPGAVRVHEGGGPENVAASFAVNIARLASTGSAPAPSAVPVAYRYRRRGLGGAWRFGALESRNPDRTIARPARNDPTYEYELLAVAAPTQEQQG